MNGSLGNNKQRIDANIVLDDRRLETVENCTRFGNKIVE